MHFIHPRSPSETILTRLLVLSFSLSRASVFDYLVARLLLIVRPVCLDSLHSFSFEIIVIIIIATSLCARSRLDEYALHSKLVRRSEKKQKLSNFSIYQKNKINSECYS